MTKIATTLKSLEQELKAEKAKSELYKLKLTKLQALEEEKKRREKLPHLYLHPRYKFQQEFEEEIDKKYQIIVSANQVGKSSTAIQRVIRIATEPETWPKYWPDAHKAGIKPAQWWYLYPSIDVASVEFREKWEPLLPKFDEDHPQYGWKVIKTGTKIRELSFNTGINIYFKSYEQSVQNLQSGSCYLLVCDEELPTNLLPELQMRTNATRGYMWFVFTATLGQEFWKNVVEERTRWKKEAKVWQVSLYDCQKYADGTKSKWTTKIIKETIAKCTSEAEAQRRVFGRFVKTEGLAFPTFNRERHLMPYRRIPKDWLVVAGVDYGSGVGSAIDVRDRGHPSSIAFVAVNPAKTQAVVMRSWRGDGMLTTCQDVVNKYKEIAETVPSVDYIYYDFSAKDLYIYANQNGLPFMPADKSRTTGVDLINVLLKNNRLSFLHPAIVDRAEQEADGIPDNMLEGLKLAAEMESLSTATSKTSAKDDLCDALRYALNGVGFDWEMISSHGSNVIGEGLAFSSKPVKKVFTVDDLRREAEEYRSRSENITEELEFWQSQIDY